MNEKSTDEVVFLEEYKSLREETIKRIELGYQIINLTFIAAGGLWTIGTIMESAKIVLALYPWLALLFAAGYGANVIVLTEIGFYIRDVLEKSVHKLRWASYFDGRHQFSRRMGNFSVYGIFAGSSLFSLATYYYVSIRPASPGDAWPTRLLLVGLAVSVIIFIILYWTLNHIPKDVASRAKDIMEKKEIELSEEKSK